LKTSWNCYKVFGSELSSSPC